MDTRRTPLFEWAENRSLARREGHGETGPPFFARLETAEFLSAIGNRRPLLLLCSQPTLAADSYAGKAPGAAPLAHGGVRPAVAALATEVSTFVRLSPGHAVRRPWRTAKSNLIN